MTAQAARAADRDEHRTLLHVARAFSAQPTLGALLGASSRQWVVREVELAEALHRVDDHPLVVWASRASADDVEALRRHLPGALLLVSVPRVSTAADVVRLYGLGADLVIRDEGVRHAAVAVAALARRADRHRLAVAAHAASSHPLPSDLPGSAVTLGQEVVPGVQAQRARGTAARRRGRAEHQRAAVDVPALRGVRGAHGG